MLVTLSMLLLIGGLPVAIHAAATADRHVVVTILVDTHAAAATAAAAGSYDNSGP